MKKLIFLSALLTLAITSVFAQLNVSVNNSTICLGTCTTLNATVSGGTAPFTYTWSTVQNLASITVCPTTTTVYTITALDNTGLTATASATVSVHPNPNVTATGATICLGYFATITGGGATSYTWNNGLGTGNPKTVTPTANTNYSVTGTDANGCTNTGSCVVMVNANPTLTATGCTVCQGSSCMITASGANVYTWNNAVQGGSQIVTPSVTTCYTITGTDLNGCTGTASCVVTVNFNIPIATSNSTICYGQCATVFASGGGISYTWSNGFTGNSFTVCPATTTTYTVTGVNAFGCTGSGMSVVAVNPLPNITISGGGTVCGEHAVLCANGGITYIWNPGSYASSCITVYPAQSGTYTVTGTDANGCTNTASVSVIVYPPTNVKITGGGTICNSTPMTITANGADTYSWSDGLGTGTSQTVSPSITTTYTVTGNNTYGCTNTAQTVVYISPTLVLSTTGDEICKGTSGTITVSGGDSYTWSNSSTTDTVYVSPLVTTTYTVTGINMSGCTGTAQAVVVVNLRPHIFTNDKYICYGNITTLVANGEGAIPPYTYT
ncbi:MAG: hypothetical protein PHD97_08385, partial [Bacteroidales bacterium]|nr:hypothetical protein [Bacteroidales bacterium]